MYKEKSSVADFHDVIFNLKCKDTVKKYAQIFSQSVFYVYIKF